MKIRILDRILVAIAGLLMLAGGAALAAQLLFGKDVVGRVGQWLSDDGVRPYIIIAGILIFALGVYCMLLLFRHKGKNDRFIMQRTETGELAISLNALESMVTKCLEQHKELSAQEVELENEKGCLVVRIRGTIAGGISIPLTVDTLQQQIKQYVTACSGIEVKEIRVEVESSGPDATDAPFAIEAPAAIGLMKGTGEAVPGQAEGIPALQGDSAAPEQTEAAKPETPVTESVQTEDELSAAAAAAAMLMNKAPEEEDDRPMHQRLFSTVEEPCIMPMPPKDLGETKPSEEAKPEAAQAEVTKAEETKAEAVKAEDAKAKTEKTEEIKAEEPKTESIKAEDAKAKTEKAEEIKAEEPKTESIKAEDAKEKTEKTEEMRVEEPRTDAPKDEEIKAEENKTEEGKTAKGKGFFSSRKAKQKKATIEILKNTEEGGIED